MNNYLNGYYTKENFVKKFEHILFKKYQGNRKDFYNDFRNQYPACEYDISQATRSWCSFSTNNAKRLPSVYQLVDLCNVLDCDIDYFLTPQEAERKQFIHASKQTGLSYETINNLNQIQQSSDPMDLIKLQCINALLSDIKNIDEIVSTLAHLIFTMDEDEITTIQATYNITSSENEKYFIDRIANSDYNYYLNYQNQIFIPAVHDNIHLSYLIFELTKDLEKIREQNKHFRELYKGNVQIVTDTSKEINILEEIHENGITELPFYQNITDAFDKTLINPNITVSFKE